MKLVESFKLKVDLHKLQKLVDHLGESGLQVFVEVEVFDTTPNHLMNIVNEFERNNDTEVSLIN
jgi:hypothetical protein